MKRILTKATAFFSAVIMMSGTLNMYSAAEDEKTAEVKVVFNITDDMTAGAKTDVADFESFVTDSSYVSIPNGVFTKDGYVFSGWTDNGIDGYLSGDSYNFSEGVTEVVFEPVWFNPKDTDAHNIIYSLDYKGEPVERPEWLKDGKAVAGQIVTPNYTRIELENAISHNLVLGDDHVLTYDKRFVMPDYDVVINHEWVERVTFTYYAGDVDRLNGNNIYSFPKFGKTQNELAGSDRFSRDGFELIGWLSDYDGEIYKPLQVITAPETDVTFTAVWSPKTYNVLFKQGNGGQNIKVEGVTDTEIICPEPDITVEGKYFAGWQDIEGNIYPAGSAYTILGAKPGSGIVLNAVWYTEDGTYEFLKYRNYGDHIEIIGLDITDTEELPVTKIEIPAEIDGLPVTRISEFAFSENSSNITSITLPDTIEQIGDYAFQNCTNLISVIIPDSVLSIGSCAFVNCSSLVEVKLPVNITSIKESTFEGCSRLISIDIPENVVTVRENAFAYCDALTKIVIPDSVLNINDYAFYGCSELVSVKLPKNLKVIANNLFSGCSSIISIDLPDSVTSIGSGAFYDCTSLSNIKFSSELSVIKDSAFVNTGFIEVVIPDGIAIINESVFCGCTNLKNVTIPDSVEKIAINAFWECESLKNITVPQTVKVLEDDFFGGYYSIGGECFYDDITISGYKGSPAEAYADENNITFINLGVSTEPSTGEDIKSTLLGDANLDGKVTIADATAIIQALGNSDEYALSEQGEQNADIVDRGDGVTGVDANAIQAIEAGLLKQTDFPITKSDYDALINK